MFCERLMKSMQEVLSEIYEDMMATLQGSQSNNSLNNETDGNTEQQVTQLRLEIQRLKWMHKQEIAEIQHNHGSLRHFFTFQVSDFT